MKATIEIVDELYRRVKAKSALEGRTVREVTEDLFRLYVSQEELRQVKTPRRERIRVDGKPAPAWFGALGREAREIERHDMEAIRQSIAAGVARERER